MPYTEQEAREDIMAEDAKKFLCLCEDEDIFEYLIREHISVKDLVIDIINVDDSIHKRMPIEGHIEFGYLISGLLDDFKDIAVDIYNQSMKISEDKK